MSDAPSVRRADRQMTEQAAQDFLGQGHCGRLATVSTDGSPYCLPLLYVVVDGEILVHNSAARGHLRSNVDHEARVCFEVDEPGQVFDYGRFECDVGTSYRSVIASGRIRVVDDRALKQRFCDALMAKYHGRDVGRPKSFYPRLHEITVYAISVERLTGKETVLPPVSQQWPALDRTRTPNATPP
jgi:nitroimidazol reductase NimA-like FMN-containing flavoprotein (pyridoxamine 5'-phosphate oxidase superfamily)